MNKNQVRNQTNENKGNVKQEAGNARGDKNNEQKGKTEKHGGKPGTVLGDVNDSAKKTTTIARRK